MPNVYLLIVLSAVLVEYILRFIVRHLNIKAVSTVLPEEFKGYYSEDKYKLAQNYTGENEKFKHITSTFSIIMIIFLILSGAFNFLDTKIRLTGLSVVPRGLIFFAALTLVQDLLSTPFSLYKTFIIEEKYGFNRITP